MRFHEFGIASAMMATGYVGAAYLDTALPIVIDLRISPQLGSIVWYLILVVCVACFYTIIGYVIAKVPKPIRIDLEFAEVDEPEPEPEPEPKPEPEEGDRPTPVLSSAPAAPPEKFDDCSGVREISPSSRRINELIAESIGPPAIPPPPIPTGITKPSMRAIRPDALEKFLIASDAEMKTRRRNVN